MVTAESMKGSGHRQVGSAIRESTGGSGTDEAREENSFSTEDASSEACFPLFQKEVTLAFLVYSFHSTNS